MKTILFFAALLLSVAVQAQTTPRTPPATVPPPATPTSGAPQIPPPIGTIDTNSGPLPTTQQPRQDRVRKRQTVMDGKASPGVENTDGRRTKRSNTKKRPASTSPATDSTPR